MSTSTRIALSQVMTGRVVTAADPGYDDARLGFNVALDPRPAAVAYPVDERDVMAAIDYARAFGLRIAPQATGHNQGPHTSLDDAILLSVADMKEVEIDLEAQLVRVGAGVRWEEVVPQLSEHGLAALHGSSPDVGIAGYSLGGGMGWLARKYGLQTNSVTAFELVTADGDFVRTDADHEPELFWALRGGGGNFGVVTAIEFKVYPVGDVYAGAMFFPFERSAEVLHAWHAMLPSLPDEMMTWANILHFPPDPAIPAGIRGESFAIVMATYLGDEEEGRRLLEPISALGPVMDTRAMVPPAGIAELAMDPRDPLPFASGHQLLDDLPVEAVIEAVGPGSGSPLVLVQLRHMGGALSRVADGAGARATLPGEVSVFALGVTPDAEAAAQVEHSLATLAAAVRGYEVGEYPNFVEAPADASAFFDADAWERLRAVKAEWDPQDVFKGNHHVPPAAG